MLEEIPLKHWVDNFYGYGSWDARFWFIPYEEGGGEFPEEVADRINYFYNAHRDTHESLCDIRELYRHVGMRSDQPKASSFNNRYEYRFGDHAVQNNIWKNLSAFVHGYNNDTQPDLLEYQKHTFASPSLHNEALITLYPLPSPHNHAWYYSWVTIPQLEFIRRRHVYQEHVYPGRIKTILTNISTYKPKVVLMFDMNNINTIKNSIQEFFPGTKFKMIKAIKGQIPQHHRADIDGTTVLITTQIPALRHNRIETGFDWEELGKRVRSENN
jgi:hypothetical protein